MVKKYTDDELLGAIEEVAELIGESPSWTRYKEYSSETHPNRKTIQTRFGSWSAAKEAAGLETYNSPPPRKEEIRNALQEVNTICGRSPTRREYTKHRDGTHPSLRQIKSVYESWNSAKKDAGLTVYRQGHGERTIEDYVRAVKYVTEEIEKIPTYREYCMEKKHYHPTGKTIRQDCGWDEVKRQARLRVSD